MNTFKDTLESFILQAQTDNLKTSHFPKEYGGLNMKVSFGMGAPARIPWIAFVSESMQVSNGFYPVYLYYKEEETLVLSYGLSETNEFSTTWPVDVIGRAETISDYFDKKVHRYGDSYIFKVYKVNIEEAEVQFIDPKKESKISEEEINNDLRMILEEYKKCFDVIEAKQSTGEIGIGLFYMEKQLEDFLIQNWDNTDLGKRFDLIVEEGELISQQYRTDIGPIDILAKDKEDGSHVVIELKKNQTSDDTLGQLARYMGWVKENLNDEAVKGIIIAGTFDKRLDYAIKVFPDIEVYSYKIDFSLTQNYSS
jgi:hypothetical protein